MNSNRLKKQIGTAILISASTLLIYSCGSKAPSEAKEVKDSTATVADKGKKPQNEFFTIPSPIELAQIMKRAGVIYNKDLLNSPKNVSNYSSNNSKALNLGVYGADLSYSTIFNQTQESVNYLNCTKKLADGLGITGAFDESTLKRMDANSGNSDSLLQIISDSFSNSNDALKENPQSSNFALCVVGGWIEGLYIGTQVAKTTKNNTDIITRIAELKGSLKNLVMLIESRKDAEGMASVLDDLKAIQSIYNEGNAAGDSKPTVTTDSKTNVVSIGGKSSFTLSKDQLEKITLKAESLRNSIIKS